MDDPPLVGRLRGAGQRLGQLGRPPGRHRRALAASRPAGGRPRTPSRRTDARPTRRPRRSSRGWGDRAAPPPRPRREGERGPGAGRTHPPGSSSRPQAGPGPIAGRDRPPPCRPAPARGSARTRGSNRPAGGNRRGGRSASVWRRRPRSQRRASALRASHRVSFEGPMDLEQVADLLGELREPLAGTPSSSGGVAELLAEQHFVIEEVEQTGPDPRRVRELARSGIPRSARARRATSAGAARPGAATSVARTSQPGSASVRLPAGRTWGWTSLIGRLVQAELPGDPGHRPGQPDPQRVRSAAEFRGDLGPAQALRRRSSSARSSGVSRRRASSRSSRAASCRLGLLTGGRAVLDHGRPVDPPLIAAIGTLPPRLVGQLVRAMVASSFRS